MTGMSRETGRYDSVKAQAYMAKHKTWETQGRKVIGFINNMFVDAARKPNQYHDGGKACFQT